MQTNYVALAVVAAYMAALGLLTSIVQRSVTTATTFTSGTTGSGVPAVLVGLMLMSEFIGTSASVGTAQEAYVSGISAAWNIIALGAGFLFYAWFLAGKYKESGHNTISGVFAEVYGPSTKVATSLVMIFALQIVAVALYAGGGAILSVLLAVDRTLATVICGVVAVLYVFVGGMRSVVYTNVIHSLMKYAGIGVALYFGLTRVGGFEELQARLPPAMFSWTNVGVSQIFAWFIAGIGATFSTQYVIQAINTVDTRQKAQVASLQRGTAAGTFRHRDRADRDVLAGPLPWHQIHQRFLGADRRHERADGRHRRRWTGGLAVRHDFRDQRFDGDAALQGFLYSAS